MAGRGNAPAPTDAQRLVLFEWQARHYRSLDAFLPPIPQSVQLAGRLPFDQWHALVLRLTAGRKFISGNDAVQLDKVWAALLGLLPDPESQMHEWLRHNIDAWPNQFDGAYSIIRNGEHMPQGTDFARKLLYGLVLHSDVDKAELLQRFAPTLDTHIWGTTAGLGVPGPHHAILDTLALLEGCRAKGHLPQLPEPWAPLWPEPTVTPDNQ